MSSFSSPQVKKVREDNVLNEKSKGKTREGASELLTTGDLQSHRKMYNLIRNTYPEITVSHCCVAVGFHPHPAGVSPEVEGDRSEAWRWWLCSYFCLIQILVCSPGEQWGTWQRGGQGSNLEPGHSSGHTRQDRRRERCSRWEHHRLDRSFRCYTGIHWYACPENQIFGFLRVDSEIR